MLNKYLQQQDAIRALITRENACAVGLAMSTACHLSGDNEAAGEWIKLAHRRIQGGDSCCCGDAERLGKVANVIGRPELADYIGTHTFCRRAEDLYRVGRPAPVNSHANSHPSDWDRKCLIEWMMDTYAKTLDQLFLSRE